MSPQPSELGRGNLSELADIIKPADRLLPALEQWVKTAGEKVGGMPALIGFILDGPCAHPVVRIDAPLKGGLFALGGEQCENLFLITSITRGGKDQFFSIDWGGTSERRIYRITSSGFTLIEDGGIGLLEGDGSGKIPVKGGVLFSQDSKQPLEDKMSSLFPYRDDETRCMSALWLSLQRAAGIQK